MDGLWRLVLYRQHILNPEYQQKNVGEYQHICRNSQFKIFTLFQLRHNDEINRVNHETTLLTN